MNDNRCNCGDTSVSFHPDENQHEPNCWICYLGGSEDDDHKFVADWSDVTPIEEPSLAELTDEAFKDYMDDQMDWQAECDRGR